jgi:hypothetical protein
MKAVAIVSSLLLAGCAAGLSQQGATVQPVTATQKEQHCQFLAIVAAEESMGWGRGGDAKGAMNKVRNQVAQAGGNAMHIISTTSTDASTTVVAEALRCSGLPGMSE